MTIPQLEDSYMSLGNESCPSMASFMSALLEEKMPRDFSCEGFTVNVDIIEDNPTMQSHEQSENNIRRSQSLVTMRRSSRSSSRQASRWANTFEPNHERSASNLFLGTSRSSDNCGRMARRRVSSSESLQLPKRMESPRTFREGYLGGTRSKHNFSNNAGWSKEDVLQSNQRSSDRLSQLFNMTLTLSPEPQSNKKTTRSTKEFQVGAHSELIATSSGRGEATTSDPHTGQISSSRRLRSSSNKLPGKPQNPLLRSTSMDSTPMIPTRRSEVEADSTKACQAVSLVAKAVQQRLKRGSSSDEIGYFTTAGSSASQRLPTSLSSFSSTGSNSSGQGSCPNLVRRSSRDSMMRRQRSHGSGMDKRGGLSGRRAGRKASYLQDPSVLGLTISKKTALTL